MAGQTPADQFVGSEGSTAGGLRPIGVFWDIENCQVPKGKSATAVVRCIRQHFFEGFSEEEFLCVCDIRKESKDVIQELNLAQVTVVHINATCKNAADDKLKQCMRRYVDTHGSQATVMLISGDVNFSTELSDFRHRRKVQVILVHGPWAPEALTACAHECHSYAALVANVPFRSPTKAMQQRETSVPLKTKRGTSVESASDRESSSRHAACDRTEGQRGRRSPPICRVSILSRERSTSPHRKHSQSRSCELVVNDLPSDKDGTLLQNRLRQLSDNCGGRVLAIVGTTAYLRFPTPDSARRACKRMDGEDVFGSKISVSLQADRRRNRQGSSDRGTTCSTAARPAAPRSGSSSPEPRSAGTPDEPSTTGVGDVPLAVELASRLLSSSSSDPERKRSTRRSLESSFCASGDSSTGDCASKNVGRVSPFLLNGRKPEGFDFIARSPSKVSPIVTTSSIWRPTRPPEENTTSLGAAAACLPSLWSGVYGSPNRRQPRWAQSGVVSCGSPTEVGGGVVELRVTNIDRCIAAGDVKKLLLTLFSEHVMVLHISLELQADGSLQANVRVPSMSDARLAVSKLNMRHVGHRRIRVAVADGARRKPPASSSAAEQDLLRFQLTQLLESIPGGCLPLVRLKELFENRYNRSIGLSQIHRLRDVVTVHEDPSGRTVVLNAAANCDGPSSAMERSSPCEAGAPWAPSEQTYCERHATSAMGRPDGWARWGKAPDLLPKVCVSLATLGPKVHALLDGHGGSLPLHSFLACYEAEFGPLAEHCDGEPWRRGCVPLEHLVASLPGVRVDFSPLGIKRVTWIENDTTGSPSPVSVPAGEALEQLGREAVELLKAQPHCSMALHSFIPAYHRHFGRQCRVADYGFARLCDLLRALSSVLQVLGQGQNRVLVLTHKAQSKRFASDMLRILKAQQNKEIKMSELPDAYLHWHRRALEVADYGACLLEDLLAELAVGNSLTVATRDGDTVIAIPRTDPLESTTVEQLENRRRFGRDVVDVLRLSPDCAMLFNKFVPAYHHHFGRQCRVADYGVSKLSQLFSTIADVVEVLGEGEEKQVKLHRPGRLRVEEERVAAVLGASTLGSLALHELEGAYTAHHGFPLPWEDLGAASLEEFVRNLGSTIRVDEEGRLHSTDGRHTRLERGRVVALLMEQLNGSVDVKELWLSHHSRYGTYPEVRLLRKMEADRVVCLDRAAGRVVLQPLHLLCRDVISVVRQHGGAVPLGSLEEFFLRRFGVPLSPSLHNFSGVAAMLSALPEYFVLRGSKKKRTVRISREHETVSAGRTVEPPVSDGTDVVEPELVLALHQSSHDLLGDPIPSCVPSPVLRPTIADATASGPDDLMKFEAAQEATEECSLLDADLLSSPPPSEHGDFETSGLSFGSAPAAGTKPVKVRIAAQFSVPLER